MTISLLFVGIVAYAQNNNKDKLYLGVSGGYSHNTLITSVGSRPFTAYKSKGGFTVGMPIRYRFNEWFALQAEPSVIQKNYTWTRTDFHAYSPKPHRHTTNTYLQLPLMVNFSFGGEKLRGFCTPGVFMGYWTGSRIKGIALDNNELPYEYDESFTFDSRRDNRFEYGLMLGLGLEYKYNNMFTFALEGRYYHSASDLQKKYMYRQVPRYNDTYVLQASVLFNLFSLRNSKKN